TYALDGEEPVDDLRLGLIVCFVVELQTEEALRVGIEALQGVPVLFDAFGLHEVDERIERRTGNLKEKLDGEIEEGALAAGELGRKEAREEVVVEGEDRIPERLAIGGRIPRIGGPDVEEIERERELHVLNVDAQELASKGLTRRKEFEPIDRLYEFAV